MKEKQEKPRRKLWPLMLISTTMSLCLCAVAMIAIVFTQPQLLQGINQVQTTEQPAKEVVEHKDEYYIEPIDLTTSLKADKYGDVHYIKLQFTVSVYKKKQVEELQNQTLALKDSFATYLSDLTPEQVSGSKNYETIKSALKEKIKKNSQLDIANVYLTEVVTQ